MAEVAGTIRHLYVSTYHDLAVAACAAQLFAPPQISQMEFMIEADPFFVSDLPPQDIGGMAARPQAAGVFNLGVGFGAVFFGHDLDYMVDGLEFRPHRRLGLGGHMTGHTGHLIVLRSFPGLVIRSHDMASVAERGAHAIEKQANEKG
jgi:hypothetical protein